MNIAYIKFNSKLEDDIIEAFKFKNRNEYRVKIRGNELILPIVLDWSGFIMKNAQKVLGRTNYKLMGYKHCENIKVFFEEQKERLKMIMHYRDMADQDILVVYSNNVNLDYIKGALKLCIKNKTRRVKHQLF